MTYPQCVKFSPILCPPPHLGQYNVEDLLFWESLVQPPICRWLRQVYSYS